MLLRRLSCSEGGASRAREAPVVSSPDFDSATSLTLKTPPLREESFNDVETLIKRGNSHLRVCHISSREAFPRMAAAAFPLDRQLHKTLNMVAQNWEWRHLNFEKATEIGSWRHHEVVFTDVSIQNLIAKV